MIPQFDVEQGGWIVQQTGSPGLQRASNGTMAMSDQSSVFIGLVEQFLQEKTRSHRVALLIGAAFSLVAALIVIVMVVIDARNARRKVLISNLKSRPNLWACIHQAEVMPLFIAIASVVQACIFLGVQSQTLDVLWAKGCALTAQIVWPAIWLVSLTVTAFSFESAFRSLKAIRFDPRGKRYLISILSIVILLTLALFIVARVSPSMDMCWGSLSWWTIHFIKPSIVLSFSLLALNLLTMGTLIVLLIKKSDMCRDERIAASRCVYSLGMNVVIITLALPFFICFTMEMKNLTASLVTDQILTLTGLLHALIHLFLRANSERVAIRPRDLPWSKRSFRLFGANDLNIHDFISTPLLADRDVERTAFYSHSSKNSLEKRPSLPREQFISIHPDVAPPAVKISNPPRKSNFQTRTYSIFPSTRPGTPGAKQAAPSSAPPPVPPVKSALRALMPLKSRNAALDEQEALQPPKPILGRHRRSDSESTSEIVEFALRLSSHSGSAASSKDSISPLSKTAGKQALLTPERYNPMERKTDEVSPIEPPTPVQVGNGFEARKPDAAPKIVGLPGKPGKKTFPQSLKSTIAARLRSSSIYSTTDRPLPPLPRSAEIPPEPSKPLVPDWRAPVTNTQPDGWL